MNARGQPACSSACLYLCFVSLLAGCGERDIEVVEVTGRVTLDGRPPPAGGTIYFSPLETGGGHALRPSSATFDRAGHYEARAFEDARGLLPGTYRVVVHCWETLPTDSGPPAKSFIPDAYTSPATSKLELTVHADARRITWDIDLAAVKTP